MLHLFLLLDYRTKRTFVNWPSFHHFRVCGNGKNATQGRKTGTRCPNSGRTWGTAPIRQIAPGVLAQNDWPTATYQAFTPASPTAYWTRTVIRFSSRGDPVQGDAGGRERVGLGRAWHDRLDLPDADERRADPPVGEPPAGLRLGRHNPAVDVLADGVTLQEVLRPEQAVAVERPAFGHVAPPQSTARTTGSLSLKNLAYVSHDLVNVKSLPYEGSS